ncbi:hypothetical protein MTO96_026299 [Rhipicephalus appendiculatus]
MGVTCSFKVPWRACSGHEGHLRLWAQLGRFSVILRVHRRGFAEEYALRYEGPTLPVKTYNVYLDVEGAGQVTRDVSRLPQQALSFLSRIIQWKTVFFPTFTKAFFTALG